MKNALLLAATFALLFTQSAKADPPVWSVNAGLFQNSMNIVAQIRLDGAPHNATGCKVGAFVGNDLRGTADASILSGQAYFFMTIFSNVGSGETLRFEAYLPSTDNLHPALETTVFQKNALLGDAGTPYMLHLSSVNDFAISLQSRPTDTTRMGVPFPDIDLTALLVSADADPVNWTAAPGQHLQANIVNGVLTVTPYFSNWTGVDTVRVTATEIGTPHGYAAAKTLTFRVLRDYEFAFRALPHQTVQPGGTFPGLDLDNFMQTPPPCADFGFSFVPFSSDVANPGWSLTPGGSGGTMTVTARVKFGPDDLASAGVTLAGFVGNQLAGMVTPTQVGDDYFYFLTLKNIATGAITWKIYDPTRQYFYQKTSGINFIANGSAGTGENPVLIQLAPLELVVNDQHVVSVNILDPTWTGTLQVNFTGNDCIYPAKNDGATAFFTIDPNYGGEPQIFSSAQIQFTELSCRPLHDVESYDNTNAEGSGLSYTLNGGADASRFSINAANGKLSWLNFSPNFEAPGDANTDNIYVVNVKVTDANGLFSVQTVQIQVLDNPEENFAPSITGDFDICPGVTTTELSVAGGQLYDWGTNETTQAITVPPGNYSVTVTNAEACTAVLLPIVTARSFPAVSIAGDLVLCTNETAPLTANSTPPGFFYQWTGGGMNQVQNVSSVGTYTVTVTDVYGCTNTASASVTVASPAELLGQRVSTDGAALDKFASSLAINGDWMLSGAPDDKVGTITKQGSAWVFGKNQGGANNWGALKLIKASDGAASDNFGNSVTVSGDFAIVGAWADNVALTDQGSAYVFARNQGGTNNWGQVKRINPSDAEAYDYFGSSVGVWGDWAVIGANKDKIGTNTAQGSAYFFNRNQGGANNWGQVVKFTATDGAANHNLGTSVAIVGEIAAVGAPGYLSNRGAVYLLGQNVGGANNWGFIKRLQASDAAVADLFGTSVSISGDYILVGAYGKLSNRGAVYVFHKNQGGANNWGQVIKIVAPDGAAGDRFGFSVEMDGEMAVVGAYSDDNKGSVYFFSKNAGGPNNWGQMQKITATDGVAGDQFGYALALENGALAVGANLDDVSARTDQGSIKVYIGEDCGDPVDSKPGDDQGSTPQSDARDLSDLSQNADVRCFPNPFSDELIIEVLSVPLLSEALEISVLDARGNLVKRFAPALGERQIQFDSSDLPSGMYFVVAQNGFGRRAVPVVLVR